MDNVTFHPERGNRTRNCDVVPFTDGISGKMGVERTAYLGMLEDPIYRYLYHEPEDPGIPLNAETVEPDWDGDGFWIVFEKIDDWLAYARYPGDEDGDAKVLCDAVIDCASQPH